MDCGAPILLVERDEPLAILAQAYDDSCRGTARVAVISGAVATGKTTLLHEFARRVAGSDAVLANATASRAEQQLPLGVLDQLLRNADLPPEPADRATALLADGTLAALRQEARPWVDDGRFPAEADLAPFLCGGWINSLWKLLRDLTVQHPLVVVVDNAHYADQHSLRCLLYLVHRLRSARLFLILTKDIAQHRGNSLLDTEFLSDPHARHIRLAPLSRRGVADLLAVGFGRAVAERLAQAFHQASGGNPLLVTALMNDHRGPAGWSGDQLIPAGAFSLAVASCLYRDEPTVSDVARAAAVLGGWADVGLLDELLGPRAPSSAPALDSLTATGLVEAGGFRHDAVRAAVLNGIPPGARSAMHRRAAQLLHDHGEEPTAVAAHLVQADHVSAGWMIRVLQAAADQAFADGDPGTATSYLRLARRAAASDRERAAITWRLAGVEWHVDPSVANRHLPELVAAARDGLLPGRQATKLIMYLLWDGRADGAHEVIDSIARRSVPDAACAAGPAVADSLRRWLCSCYPDLLAAAGPRQHTAAQRIHTATGSQQAHTSVLGAALSDPVQDKVFAAEQVLEGSRLQETTLAPIVVAITTLICLDQHERAGARCKLLLEEAAERHIRTWQAVFSALYALIRLRQGDLACAKEHASAALNLISPRGWGVAIGVPLGTTLLASTMMGVCHDAASYLAIKVPEEMFRTPFALHYLYARGRYHLATSSFRAALADFLTCGDLMIRWGLDLPSVVPWRTGAAEACLALGREQQAREFTDQQLARAGTERHRTRAISLRMRAAVTEVKSRPTLLREAIDLLNRCGDLAELALAFADLSHVYDALGEGRQARMMARRARHLAGQCGVRIERCAAADASDPEAGDVTAERSASLPADLSDAELRVATLATQGYMNRQIADQLFITVSTVEQHLTRVYRKLNINRRADLPLGLQIGAA